MLQKLYNNSPIFFQNIMVSIKGITFNKERYSNEYYKELKMLRDIGDPFEFQEKRFSEFIKYVRSYSDYHSQRLSGFKENIEIKDLKRLPLMNKETIRKNISEIITRQKNISKSQTGGSTGKSLIYYSHPIDKSRKIAYLDYFKEKHGVYKGMRRVSVGGRVIVPDNQKKKIFWRYNKALNQLLLSAYHADGENLRHYINKLNDFKPETLDGFTTVLHRLAKYIIDNQIRLSFKPIAIFPTAEALTQEMKEDIEHAFNCPVRNQYASSEGAPFITENIEGVLEINPETGVFELEHIQDNIYELIVTGFYTSTTPLLRYKIGDAVELYEKLPEEYRQRDIKIKRIIGRSNDFLLSNERGIVTNVNLSTVIKEAGNQIIESQFVQNSLNEIVVNLILDKKADTKYIETKLTSMLKTRFGKSTKFKFKYGEELVKTPGGKTRFTINNIK